MTVPRVRVYRTSWAWLITCEWCGDGLVGVETSEERADQFVTAHYEDEDHIVARFAREMETL